MYSALLLATTLGAGLILHGAASLCAFLLWRLFRGKLDNINPRLAARVLFVLRMAPLGMSALLLALFVVPSFLEFEPRTTIEPVSFTLLALACLFAILISGSAARSIFALIQSRRVMRAWAGGAQIQSRPLQGISFYRCEAATPVIAVMGIFRNRIFAASSVVDALTAGELEAALRHEAVHVRHFDIFKKMLLQLAPAFLPGVDFLRPLAAHWARMCELAADEESVVGDHERTLDLASALVKVARLADPAGAPPLPTLSAALAQKNESLLGFRVQRLLQISEHPEVLAPSGSFDLRKAALASLALLALVSAVYPQVLDFTHELLEFLVQG